MSSDDELRRLRDELGARTAEVEAVFRALPDLLFELAPEGTITRYRAGREEDLYVAPREFLGKRMSDVLPREAAAVIEAAAERVRGGEPLACVEYDLPMHDGPRQYEARLVPFADGCVIILVRDVTEQRRAQEERRQLDRKMEEAQRLESLGVLAGGIAHDFNNLLASIVGGAELIARHAPEGSPLTEPLEIVRQAAWRASELSRQLLVYAGRSRLEMQHVDLGELVLDTAQLLGTAISKRARLALDLAPELPAVRGDVAQLRQVVMNVITNASDALGGRDGRIILSAHPEEIAGRAGVLLEIQDDGCGMDAATRARMFDPFFSTKGIGRGLGLAAVRGIVRAHDGTIDIESSIGRGTRVRIWVPASSDVPRPVAASAPPPIEAMGGGVVLVVDDDDSVREVIARTLEESGLVALRARDGAHAIDIFREHDGAVDAVVMDVIMPQLAGYEAFAELRRIDPRVPVILMSGFDEKDTRELGIEPQPTFIRKPFATSALLRAIASALASRARDRDLAQRAGEARESGHDVH